MQRTIFDLSCLQCGILNTRAYGWMDPAQFKIPDQAYLISAFHCYKCGILQAIKIQFEKDQQMKIIERIPSEKLIREEKLLAEEFLSERQQIEILSEEDAITLLREEE